MLLTCFSALLVAFGYSQPLYPLPSDLVEELKLDVRARIDKFQRADSNHNFSLLPTAVRLAFHDCGGDDYCDGCINHLDSKEHAGLEFGAIYPIEQVYQNELNLTINDPEDGEDIEYTTNDGWSSNPSGLQWSNLVWNNVEYNISRSDFWILFATASLDYGVKIANDIDSTLTPVTNWTSVCVDTDGNGVVIGDTSAVECVEVLYLYGRTSCATSPFISYDGFHTNSHWGYEELIRFFNKKWNMTPLNVVSLLGVHTLGQGHSFKERSKLKRQKVCCSGSGFRGKWDTSIEIAALDNQYYDWLFRRQHVRKPADFKRFDSDTTYDRFGNDTQWVTVSGDYGAVTSLTNLFLDIDVHLFMNMSNTSIECNHPKMEIKFAENRSSNGDEYVFPSDDFGHACVRREIEGLNIGNPWDVFDEDNLAWLFNLQEPWELMTWNNYDYRNNIPPTLAPQISQDTTLPPQVSSDTTQSPQVSLGDTEALVSSDTPSPSLSSSFEPDPTGSARYLSYNVCVVVFMSVFYFWM